VTEFKGVRLEHLQWSQKIWVCSRWSTAMTLISRVPPNGGRLNMLMMGQLLLKVN